MAQRPKPEEIVSKLRQVDVRVSQGQSVAASSRAIGVTEVTYSRWRKEYGSRKSDPVKRMKGLETENQRLRISHHRPNAGQADLAGGVPGKRLLYSGFMGQLPLACILDQRVNGPAELLLLSEVGLCRLMMGSEEVGGAI